VARKDLTISALPFYGWRDSLRKVDTRTLHAVKHYYFLGGELLNTPLHVTSPFFHIPKEMLGMNVSLSLRTSMSLGTCCLSFSSSLSKSRSPGSVFGFWLLRVGRTGWVPLLLSRQIVVVSLHFSSNLSASHQTSSRNIWGIWRIWRC